MKTNSGKYGIQSPRFRRPSRGDRLVGVLRIILLGGGFKYV